MYFNDPDQLCTQICVRVCMHNCIKISNKQTASGSTSCSHSYKRVINTLAFTCKCVLTPFQSYLNADTCETLIFTFGSFDL